MYKVSSLDEAAESCTREGESPVVEKLESLFFLSRVAWGT